MKARGPLVATGLLGVIVAGYLGVIVLTGPAGAQPAPTTPTPPLPGAAAVPPQGQLQQAVTLAEEHVDGVAVAAETENGAGAYEVKVVRGVEEIELVVDVQTGQVVVLEREVESSWDD